MSISALPVRTWPEVTACEPRLADLAEVVASSTPPTREPGYGRCWLALSAYVGQLAGPLGHVAYLVSLDHVHRLYTDAELLNSTQ